MRAACSVAIQMAPALKNVLFDVRLDACKLPQPSTCSSCGRCIFVDIRRKFQKSNAIIRVVSPKNSFLKWNRGTRSAMLPVVELCAVTVDSVFLWFPLGQRSSESPQAGAAAHLSNGPPAERFHGRVPLKIVPRCQAEGEEHCSQAGERILLHTPAAGGGGAQETQPGDGGGGTRQPGTAVGQ